MSTFKCDWTNKHNFKCSRKPFVEIFPLKDPIEMQEIEGWDFEYPQFEGNWSYLCLRHFILAKLKGHKFCYCRVDSNRDALEDIKEMLWDIGGEIIAIKEKFGITDPDIKELEELLDEKSSKDKKSKNK